MAGLNKKQIKQLEKNPGIDQTLLNTYKQNNPGETPAETVNPNDAVGRISTFNAALNVAVDQARQQRKDSVLDMVGGMIPAGALPASSFARVLSAFDADSAPLEASLIDNASKFAQDQEKMKNDARASIQELALKVAENGGSSEIIASVLSFAESGNITDAIKAAGTALSTKTGGKVKSEEGKLIRVNSDGSETVLYSASDQPGYSDLSGMSAAKIKEYIKSAMDPNYYAALDAELNDAEIRQFYEFWMTLNNAEQRTVRADVAYKQWLAAVEAAKKESGIPEKKTNKTEDKEDDVYSVTGIPQ